MTWKHQEGQLKKLKNLPTPKDIIVLAGGIQNLRDRALFIILYLTAGRISEIANSLQIKDIDEVERNGRKVLLIRLRNEKNKERQFKDIPIPFDKENELIQMLYEYLDNMDYENYVFNKSRFRAYQIIKEKTGFNPHFIRHMRLTHLTVYYDFNDQLLSRFAGWTDSRPAKHYMELKWTDILQKY
jgi:integrase